MPRANPLPSVEYLRECFDYDPDTGILRWRVRPVSHFKGGNKNPVKSVCKRWNAFYAGKPTGSPTGEGHLRVYLDNVNLLVHRVVWKLQTGRDPEMIDHINRDGCDNRWANLREATHSQNEANKAARSRSGFKGVFRHRVRWRAKIRVPNESGTGLGRMTHIGMFDTPEEAYDAAALKAFGEFACTNEALGLLPPDTVNNQPLLPLAA